jgi:hypothetical protein
MPLSDVAIRKAKPAAKPYKLADGGGLYLLLNPIGSNAVALEVSRCRRREAGGAGARIPISL